MSAANWQLLIDHFLSSTYRRVSSSNKRNRALLPHTSAHGSCSYAQRRRTESKEGKKPRHIEGWRDMRYKEGTGWCTDRARVDWEKIQEQLRNMQEEVGEGGEVDEMECLKRALGDRRGHSIGVGRKPSLESLFARGSTSKSKKSSKSRGEQATKAELVALSQSYNDYFQAYNANLAAQFPNFQPPPPPPMFHYHSTTTEAPDEDEEDDEENDVGSDEEVGCE